MQAVVIGYAPKAEGEAALAAGIEEARIRGAKVLVVHGQRDGEPTDLGPVRAALDASGLEHELRVVTEGSGVAETLVEVAEESAADLIVIGVRRRTPVGKLILGSNAQRVLLDAPCPVLTVKPSGSRR